jgi:hypothetical protein
MSYRMCEKTAADPVASCALRWLLHAQGRCSMTPSSTLNPGIYSARNFSSSFFKTAYLLSSCSNRSLLDLATPFTTSNSRRRARLADHFLSDAE